jgi:hypothetical protein
MHKGNKSYSISIDRQLELHQVLYVRHLKMPCIYISRWKINDTETFNNEPLLLMLLFFRTIEKMLYIRDGQIDCCIVRKEESPQYYVETIDAAN